MSTEEPLKIQPQHDWPAILVKARELGGGRLVNAIIHCIDKLEQWRKDGEPYWRDFPLSVRAARQVPGVGPRVLRQLIVLGLVQGQGLEKPKLPHKIICPNCAHQFDVDL